MPSTCARHDSPQERIDAEPLNNCPICGSAGSVLYGDLRDRTFDATGSWSFRICRNSACRLLWLDPMPSSEHLWKAYRHYYTHSDTVSGHFKQDLPRRLFRRAIAFLKIRYLMLKYGYCTPGKVSDRSFLGWAAYVMPWRRSEWDVSAMFLARVTGGALLEVGCGGGDLLRGLRDMGWEVEGIDVDPAAVKAAKAKSLTVTLGSLETVHYPDDHFDAICMCHVIEHVRDPVTLLRECHRILKPNGRLSLVTPNADSFLHRLFGYAWFPLEPPRHLHLFTSATIRVLLRTSGFDTVRTFTTIRDADGLFVASRSIQRTGRFKMRSAQQRSEKILGRMAQVLEFAFLSVNGTAGEELSVIAQKRP